MAKNVHRYKSKRERFETHKRNIKLILIFGGIGLAVWIFKDRYLIWNWIERFFY